MLILFWGPFDRIDFFTDAVGVVQQFYCSDSVHERWVTMWQRSPVFFFLAPVAEWVDLWVVQLAVFLLAAGLQYWSVMNGATVIREVEA